MPSHSKPCVRTPLPGPRARQLLERDANVVSPSYTRAYPLVAARGKDVWIEDVDGNVFLDFAAGIAVCATGHCHPEVVGVICEQAETLIHLSGTDFYYAPQIELAEKLVAIAPGNFPKKVFFTNSGAEAVEAAIKLSRFATHRPHLIAFYGGFHGRTMGALTLTASKPVQHRGFLPLLPEVSHVTFPTEDCEPTWKQLAELFHRKIDPREVAAIVVEPIQGEGGYLVPPPEFLRGLKDICEKHAILLVADEIQSGMGRTGRMFAIEHFGVQPDILCVAKGIASGLPLGAIIARAELMSWPPGAHASTFGGNPVACRAALATIRLLESSLIANAARMGEILLQGMDDLAKKYPFLGHVRGKGLMAAMDVFTDETRSKLSPARRQEILKLCFEGGLLLLGCGDAGIRFCPPLTVGPDHVSIALDLLGQACENTEGEIT
ncbi:MAG: acetyl ornithine aminotransferase family protein [Planctomycetes bacterium]|nr:acetyl ornithine aminotransferase family protein [Planctomycetota bacterium]